MSKGKSMITAPKSAALATKVEGGMASLGKREQNARLIRRRILDAARQLFSKDGYQTATITKIRKRADVSIATFYKYFDSKQAVLLAVLHDDHDSYKRVALEALASPVHDPVDYLLRVILATLDPPDSAEAKALWREILAAFMLLSSDNVGVETISSDRDYYSSLIIQGLEKLIEFGSLSSDMPLQTLADILYCLSSHEFQDFICGRYESGGALRTVLARQIDVILAPWRIN